MRKASSESRAAADLAPGAHPSWPAPATREIPRATRYQAATVPEITGVRLSPGDVVRLVNISASGALVEGSTRFVTGTRVTVHLQGTIATKKIEGTVVRCKVSAIGTDGGLRYQCGLAFDRRLKLPLDNAAESSDSEMPHPGDEPPADSLSANEASLHLPSDTTRPRVYNRW